MAERRSHPMWTGKAAAPGGSGFVAWLPAFRAALTKLSSPPWSVGRHEDWLVGVTERHSLAG
jgi:hypothetical protein